MSIWPTDCFTGRTVLVTGGSSGIGAAIAAAFLVGGAHTVFTGATAEEVAVAQATPALAGGRGAMLDVRDDAAVRSLIDELPALHHVVNCAGVIRRHAEHEIAVFEDVLDINLTGTMRVCAAARPRLKASGGGTIVNTASMLSFFGGPLTPAYTASKGGVAQLTKSLAIAYAEDGIRVNAIAPGWIHTPLTRGVQDDPTRYETIRNRTALKRWGEPGDIAGGVLFLSSPLAAYVTGTILPIDGGYLAV
jgi:NAD(P)-dependent dehydrogenase (short-subunit alcohol dehydrogenase family)